MLARLLPDRGIAARVCANLDLSNPVPATVVHIGASAEETGDPVEELIDRCMDIESLRGATGRRRDHALAGVSRRAREWGFGYRLVETGAWAFSRTLANEFPNLDVRRVDISPSAAAELAALRLRDIVASGTEETEIQIDDEIIRAVRVDPLKQVLDRSPQPVPTPPGCSGERPSIVIWTGCQPSDAPPDRMRSR